AAAPWGRAPVAAGASRCRVRVAWAGAGVAYPALLDPSWASATNSMTVARSEHTSTKLSDGRVLVVGGASTAGDTATSDLFDPATGTFAAAGVILIGATPAPRRDHAAVLLGSGHVLVAGGQSTATILGDSYEWDPATGIFTKEGDLTNPRYGFPL